MATPLVARRLREGQLKKSPIRQQIMKLADRRNIVAMGLDPNDVISFAGGWVNHKAPEKLRTEYSAISDDPVLFHELGAYSPTRGLPSLREALLSVDAALYGTRDLSDDNILVGGSSTQLTHTLFTLLDPGSSSAVRSILCELRTAAKRAGRNRNHLASRIRCRKMGIYERQRFDRLILPGTRVGIQSKSLTFLSSPDNPTSRLIQTMSSTTYSV